MRKRIMMMCVGVAMACASFSGAVLLADRSISTDHDTQTRPPSVSVAVDLERTGELPTSNSPIILATMSIGLFGLLIRRS